MVSPDFREESSPQRHRGHGERIEKTEKKLSTDFTD
jgi:hypothetical protein